MRLLRVELRRFWSRRLMRLLVVGVAVGIVIYGVVLFVTHSPERPSVASVQAQIDEAVQECRRSSDRNYTISSRSLAISETWDFDNDVTPRPSTRRVDTPRT